MNKQQRKELSEAFTTLDYDSANIAALGTGEAREAYASEIDTLKETIEGVRDTEQEKYDNMPESLQSGSKGDDQQNVIDELESAIDSLEQAAAAVRDDYPDGDKPATEDIEAWAEEVQSKIQEAESTATSV